MNSSDPEWQAWKRERLRKTLAELEAGPAPPTLAEDAADLTVPLSLRVSPGLASALRTEANRRNLAVSELVRRTLIAALTSENDPPDPPADASALRAAEVERIARRVVREELDASQPGSLPSSQLPGPSGSSSK